MHKFGQHVDGAIKALNAQKAVEFHRLKEAWLKAVGPILAGQAEPTKIRGGTLYVTVSSPAWSQEIGLQQRLILGRLKSTMHKPPTKIACWVGQPHQGGPVHKRGGAKVPEAERPPWADQPVPAARQQRIEAMLAALEDEGQRLKLRPLVEMAVKRELYFLDQGLLPCPVCGAMRAPELETCDRCQKERVLQSENKLLRLMARKPWLKVRDVQDLAPWSSRAQVIRLKKQLRTNLLRQAWELSESSEGEELLKKITPAYRKLMLDITMLTCGVTAESLKARHFTYSLGKRLGQAYLSSIPPEQPDIEA